MVFKQIGPSTRPPTLIVSSHGLESTQLFHTYTYTYWTWLATTPPFFCQVDRKALLNISKIYGSKMPVISSKISKYCFVSIFFNEGKSINGKIFNYFLSLVSELLQEKIRANFDESPKSKIVLDVGNSTYTMEIQTIRVFLHVHHMYDQLNKLNRSHFMFELPSLRTIQYLFV